MDEASNELRIMRTEEVAQTLGISIETLRGMAARGEFPAPVFVTRRVRGWMSDEVTAWLESRRSHRTIRQVRPWTPETSRSAAQ